MEDKVILYASPAHLNTMSVLAKFISKYHPSIPIIIIGSSPDSAAASVAAVPSITYRRLPTPVLPPNPTKDPVALFFETTRLNNPNLRDALQEISQQSRIRAFVMDFFCNPAFEVSTSLKIPTYFYVSPGSAVVSLFLYFAAVDQIVPGDIRDFNDFIEVPGSPPVHSLSIPRPMHFRQSDTYKNFVETSKNMRKSMGILTDGFDALEFRAKQAILNGLCVPNEPSPPVYLVGPLLPEVSSVNGAGESECLKWLDQQPAKSVIFLCFGRRGVFSAGQLKEMAVGLENCGHRFLWSVRNPPEKQNVSPDLDELLPEGFLERTKDRGFVIKSWAPQREVLSHGSLGGFVTHCGRSSVLEALSFGVPMIGWPIDAEQPFTRVFLAEEIKVMLPLEAAADGFVTAAELEKRVRELMDSKTGRALRHRVTEMKIASAAAVQGNGSSVVALQKFIESATRY